MADANSSATKGNDVLSKVIKNRSRNPKVPGSIARPAKVLKNAPDVISMNGLGYEPRGTTCAQRNVDIEVPSHPLPSHMGFNLAKCITGTCNQVILKSSEVVCAPSKSV